MSVRWMDERPDDLERIRRLRAIAKGQLRYCSVCRKLHKPPECDEGEQS